MKRKSLFQPEGYTGFCRQAGSTGGIARLLLHVQTLPKLEIIQQASKASYPNVESTHTVLQPLLLSVAKSTGFHHPILSSKSIFKIVLRSLQGSQIAPPPQRAQGELALLRLFIQHSFRSFPTFTYKI
ncbi:MAG: hypothetical protein DWH80_03980 [Planctomycetota bacterium]|nr:MAG: hypothetical protein DWH80_03980 [Planctomycetota bacterium]